MRGSNLKDLNWNHIGTQPLLGIVYATDAKIEPAVKVIGVFPDNSHDLIICPVTTTVNAKTKTMQALAFLRCTTRKLVRYQSKAD